MKRCSIALAVLVCLPLLARAADAWPEFRGPTGQGHVAKGDLPTEWDQTKNVAWKATLPGVGWSSPVVADGRLYLTTAVRAGNAHSLRVLCVDAKDGKLLWNEEVFEEDAKSPRIQAKNSHASPTPIL